jgi:hypothetical protein
MMENLAFKNRRTRPYVIYIGDRRW